VRTITISTGEITLSAELDESGTAQKIWEALPIVGRVNTWGEEIYFEIPVIMEQAPDARAEAAVGELGYWPTGHAFCIFFGRTPASVDETPRAISPVNIFGKITDGAKTMMDVKDGQEIRIAQT